VSHMRRRAFTVIELLLALVLAGLVVTAALSIFGLLTSAERVSESQFEAEVEVASTQLFVRRVMQSLLAGADEGDPAMTDGPRAETDQTTPVTEAPLRDPAAGGRAMFEIYFEQVEPGVTAPVVELVLSKAPVQVGALPGQMRYDAEFDDLEEEDGEADPMQTALFEEQLRRENRLIETVRGRLEVARRGTSFVLQWRPISPAGEPYVLVPNVEWLEWSALPRDADADAWSDVWAAYLREDFPMAVRLALWTTDGRHEDWLFEPLIAVRGR